ncbi:MULTISPECIES: type II toxin-antitoxin system RelE/ParE family toxin [Paraburkholderia]|uniref:type II toxin-antitoxin system RelE/ParE family toxin n=1 Tax=Paraburkholderia TaxID=1822464 RepID=UPI0038B8537D
MTHRVVILESAEDDIREIRHYVVSQLGQSTWSRTWSTLKNTIRRLADFPDSGGRVDELRELNMIHVSTGNLWREQGRLSGRRRHGLCPRRLRLPHGSHGPPPSTPTSIDLACSMQGCALPFPNQNSRVAAPRFAARLTNSLRQLGL